MRFTVYKTTNLVNGKFYVGHHSTKDPNDSYLGSGFLLRAAIKKYGRAAFRKEVLFDFDSREEMEAKEREIVDQEFLGRSDVYNLAPGGRSPLSLLSHEEVAALAVKGNKRKAELARTDPVFKARQSVSLARRNRRFHQEGLIPLPSFAGRRHSEETRRKMGESCRLSSLGSRNSQHGTCWISREGEKPRKIKRTELPQALEEGWQQGRRGKNSREAS